jgi:hypothetical protein
MQLPWANFVVERDGLVSFIKNKVYSKVEGRNKLLNL